MSRRSRAIQCPECGENTSELYHARLTEYGEEVLMCDACYDDSDEGLYDYDKSWEGELNDAE